MLFCTFAAAAAAPPLVSPASDWSRAYTHPQPGITERERGGGRERKRERERERERQRDRHTEDGGKKGRTVGQHTTITWSEKKKV